MYRTVQIIHSYWAYIVLLIVVLATINALAGFFSKREYGAKDFRISLFALIVTHFQLLIGLVLYFISPLGLQNISNIGMGEVMKNAEFRLYAVEHPFVMILAAVLLRLAIQNTRKNCFPTANSKPCLY